MMVAEDFECEFCLNPAENGSKIKMILNLFKMNPSKKEKEKKKYF